MLLVMKTHNVIGAFRSVTVKRPFIVSQIVSCPVVISQVAVLSQRTRENKMEAVKGS